MNSPYHLGTIWRRRDGKDAVVISGPDEQHLVRVIVAATRPGELPYLVHTATGRASLGGNTSPMDLIHRTGGLAAADLIEAADDVVAAWPTGDLATAVNDLRIAADDARKESA